MKNLSRLTLTLLLLSTQLASLSYASLAEEMQAAQDKERNTFNARFIKKMEDRATASEVFYKLSMKSLKLNVVKSEDAKIEDYEKMTYKMNVKLASGKICEVDETELKLGEDKEDASDLDQEMSGVLAVCPASVVAKVAGASGVEVSAFSSAWTGTATKSFYLKQLVSECNAMGFDLSVVCYGAKGREEANITHGYATKNKAVLTSVY